MSATDNFRDLIDRMKAEAAESAKEEALELVPDEPLEEGVIEAANPVGTREVFRQLALIKIQRAALEKVEKQLVTAANAMIAENRGIAANGELLAKHSTNPVTRVNTEAFKSTFPADKYPQFYTTTEETRLLLDPEFKRVVYAEATKDQEIEA